MNEIRELIDTELDTVSGGLFDIGVDVQTIVAPQIALAIGGPGVFAQGGSATSVNAGGVLKNLGIHV
jgi:hypothetical protein